MKISLTAHAVGQGAALIVQYANMASGVVPAKDQPYVALAVGVCQALMAFAAHFSPVPGQPAQTGGSDAPPKQAA